MSTDPFDGLHAFLAVGTTKSFTAAAARLAVTPTAMSQKIKALEARLGVVLFQRTTRRVALTEAGALLYARLGPAAGTIEDALAALGDLSGQPTGTLRITAPRVSARRMAKLVAAMKKRAPAVNVEIALDDAFVDLVGSGFDVGVRLGDTVEKDMVRIPLTKAMAWSIVASKGYLARAGRPETVADLMNHQAIGQRLPTSGAVYRWELSPDSPRRGRRAEVREIAVDVRPAIVVNDVDLLLALAREGLGLAYVPDDAIAADLASGRLERVLDGRVGAGPGLNVYFPARTQSQPKLRALLDCIKERNAEERA